MARLPSSRPAGLGRGGPVRASRAKWLAAGNGAGAGAARRRGAACSDAWRACPRRAQRGGGGVDLSALAARSGLPPATVRELGRLADAELLALMHGALALVAPSRAEAGWTCPR